MLGAARAHCMQQVKKYDRENYLAGLCIRDEFLRRATFALRAFNVELSLVRDSTGNSDAAKLRLNFWSRLVDELARRQAMRSRGELMSEQSVLDKEIAYYKHTPVAKELLDVFGSVEMDNEMQQLLRHLIGARLSRKVLGYQSFESLTELELYCSRSNEPIYQLCFSFDRQRRGGQEKEDGANLASSLRRLGSAIGTAQGLSNVIRGIPYNATKKCCYIPDDLLARHQLSFSDLSGEKLNGEQLAPAVESLALRCQELLDEASAGQANIPAHLRDLFLPRVAIQSSLRELKRFGYNICGFQEASTAGKKNGNRRNRSRHWLALNMWLVSKLYWAPIW